MPFNLWVRNVSLKTTKVLFKNSVSVTKVTPSIYASAYSDIWASERRVASRAKRLQVSA